MEAQEPTFIETADGTPTLAFGSSENILEAMHSSSGAWGETVHVYLPVLERVYSQPEWPKSFLSLGLGLGYVEIMTAAFLIQKNHTVFKLETFESNSILRQNFLNWLEGKGEAPWTEIYHRICTKAASHFKIEPEKIFNFLKMAKDNGSWVMHEGLHRDFIFEDKFSGLFFDAFSKLNRELWTKEFLDWFLKYTAYKDCVFATYASRGSLKRTLREAGFKLVPRVGWGRKRECTLAIRSKE